MYLPNPGRIAASMMAHVNFEEPGDPPAGEDHSAHAAGQTCVRCGHSIEAEQAARRSGETGWVHDVCPVVTQ